MGAIILLILCFGLAIPGVGFKNGVLTWASVPMWIILGWYINANYTWLAEAQWIFILLGAGLAIGMAFETTTYKPKKETEDGGEVDSALEPEQQEILDQKKAYQKQRSLYRQLTQKSSKYDDE